MPETNRSSPDFLKSLNSFARQKHDTFWLATRFLEKQARIKALCVLCLDGEFFRVVSSVNEEIVAQFRLQWWRDEIDRLLGGETGQLTLAGQALSCALDMDPQLNTPILRLIDAYDDIASGQGGDYAEALFAALFAANELPENVSVELRSVCGAVFQSANAGALNKAAINALTKLLATIPDAAWPFVCLFEFVPDWVRKQKPGPFERRWRILKAFLGGEARLKKRLLAVRA